MITTINTYVVQTSDDDDEITQAWNQELRDELKALDPTSYESIPVLHKFLSIWILLPLEKRLLTTRRRTFMNVPDFSKLRIYFRGLLEGWNLLTDEQKNSNSLLSSFFFELDHFLALITDAQSGISHTFFSRFASCISLFKISNRNRLVQVPFVHFHFLIYLHFNSQ